MHTSRWYRVGVLVPREFSISEPHMWNLTAPGRPELDTDISKTAARCGVVYCVTTTTTTTTAAATTTTHYVAIQHLPLTTKVETKLITTNYETGTKKVM